MVLVPIACGGSGSGRTARLGAGAAGLPPFFTGVGSAEAISPTEVVVSWSDAIDQVGEPNTQSMIYRVYRAFDPASVLLESALIGTTDPGITSFVDIDAIPFTTHYYRVEAINTLGNQTTSLTSATARTPSLFEGGSIEFYGDIDADPGDPLSQNIFETIVGSNGLNCLSCHTDGGSAYPLDTYEGIMAGVGTFSEPDSFVIPFDPEGSWLEFVARFSANPIDHLPFVSAAAEIAALEAILGAWINEGALEFPDDQPPVFEFDDIDNAGKYYAEFTGFDKVTVTWFHASDPESLPPTGDTTNQLEYYIYVGTSSNTIDWENPARTVCPDDLNWETADEVVTMSPMKTGPDSLVSAEFGWCEDTAAIVIRAIDAAGRNEVLSDPPTPEETKRRLRNMSVNEREIFIQR
ncbi:MAG: hypothetical protein DWQ01_09470 [Planctomycetota bacterium]|nr:MAG: hypothetical protein DWQ01_09470 [Planctomycetota bacterium]